MYAVDAGTRQEGNETEKGVAKVRDADQAMDYKMRGLQRHH